MTSRRTDTALLPNTLAPESESRMQSTAVASERRSKTPRGIRWWTIRTIVGTVSLAVVVALGTLSLNAPLGTKGTLELMHLVVATPIVVELIRPLQPRLPAQGPTPAPDERSRGVTHATGPATASSELHLAAAPSGGALR